MIKKIISLYFSNHKKYALSLLVFCAFLFLTPIKNACAQSFFTLTSSHVKYYETAIQVDFFFNLSNLDEIDKILKDGVSINVDTLAHLYEKNTIFPDEELQTFISGWQITYEPLTNEYLLYHKNNTPQKSRDLEELFQSILSHIKVELNYLEPLDRSNDYYIQLDLGLRHATVPPWLETTLFFWKWDIASSNYIVNLRLPNLYQKKE